MWCSPGFNTKALRCDLLLYADDSCLMYEEQNTNEIENRLNRALFLSVTGLLKINEADTSVKIKKSILFGTKRKMKNMCELDIRHRMYR